MAVAVTEVADLSQQRGRPLRATSVADVNGVGYFTNFSSLGFADEYGDELWRTDGTSAGTRLVKDIAPGSANSLPSRLTNVNGTLFFFTQDEAGKEVRLWKTNGTGAGTLKLASFRQESFPETTQPVVFKGQLYFTAGSRLSEATDHGYELWKSDGTPSGTIRVAEINPGSEGSNPQNFTVVGNELFFAATKGNFAETTGSGTELWKTNGTAAGTVPVRDINPGPRSSDPGYLTNLNGTLLFSARTFANGTELWRSDGTSAGTRLVKDIVPGRSGSLFDPETSMQISQGKAVFEVQRPGSPTREIWKSDGTPAGTTQLADNVDRLRAVNSDLVFYTERIGNQLMLKRSDGTPSGTLRLQSVTDRATGNTSPKPPIFSRFTFDKAEQHLYYSVAGPVGEPSLWVTDGTVAGTQSTSQPAAPIAAFGNGLLLAPTGSQAGPGLWNYNPALGSAVEIRDLTIGNEGSYARDLANQQGTLYFTAQSGHGPQTYRIGAPGANPEAVQYRPLGMVDPNKPIVNSPGVLLGGSAYYRRGAELLRQNAPAHEPAPFFTLARGTIDELARVGGKLYFIQNIVEPGKFTRVLWSSNGTSAGTVKLHTVHAGFHLQDVTGKLGAEARGKLLFVAEDANSGDDLWITDGTVSGTKRLKEIRPGTAANTLSPVLLPALNAVFFSNSYVEQGRQVHELWKTDGTAAGTVRLKETNRYLRGNSTIFEMGNKAYINGYLVTDGTTAGTRLLRSQELDGKPLPQISHIVQTPNAIYFTGVRGFNEIGLWKIGPDDKGPRLLRTLNTSVNAFATDLIVAEGRVYVRIINFEIAATTHLTGWDLWTSDGTVEGTIKLHSFEYDPATPRLSEIPFQYAVLGDKLYFHATTGIDNSELWMADGNNVVTRRLKDIYTGPNGSRPLQFVVVGRVIYFSALSREHGRELWQIVDESE